MKHTIDTTAKQEAALTSLAGKLNASQNTTLTNLEYLTQVVTGILDEEVERLDEDDLKAITVKLRAATKAKRDQVKALLP
jgi:hypothetical protein